MDTCGVMSGRGRSRKVKLPFKSPRHPLVLRRAKKKKKKKHGSHSSQSEALIPTLSLTVQSEAFQPRHSYGVSAHAHMDSSVQALHGALCWRGGWREACVCIGIRSTPIHPPHETIPLQPHNKHLVSQRRWGRRERGRASVKMALFLSESYKNNRSGN